MRNATILIIAICCFSTASSPYGLTSEWAYENLFYGNYYFSTFFRFGSQQPVADRQEQVRRRHDGEHAGEREREVDG